MTPLTFVVIPESGKEMGKGPVEAEHLHDFPGAWPHSYSCPCVGDLMSAFVRVDFQFVGFIEVVQGS